MLQPSRIAFFCSFLLVAGCGSSDEVGRGKGDGDGSDATVTENHPGDLVITSPARAEFIAETADGLVTVTGTGATDALEIDGQSVVPAADGSFTATVLAVPGVNVVRVVDGESAVDTPFVYGRFAPASDAVPAAVAVRINELGFADPDTSKVSLTLVANSALADIDLLGALDGKTFEGDIPGGQWTFEVESTSYSRASVELGPRSEGADFAAVMDDLQVDGILSVEVFGVGPSGHVTLTADAAEVSGDIKVWLEGSSDSIAASAPSATTTLKNFQYDSGNAGFPCCVDDIMTSILRPKIQSAAQDKVKQALSQEVAFALTQFSLPSTLDLSGAGFPAVVGIEEGFDGAKFDPKGGRLTAAVRFHAEYGASDVGSAAPGWLTVAQPPAPMPLDAPFGVSISLDALNQALFAAWAQNGLERTFEDVPLAGSVHLTPRLPPIVLPNGEGGLLAAAGEIVIDAEIDGSPVQAAITIRDDLELTIDSATRSVLLSPAPQPQISITWLSAEGLDDGFRDTIEAMIIAKLPSLLTPVTLPLPTIPLGAIASSFGDSVGTLGPAAVLAVDAETSRLGLFGDLAIVP